MDVGDRLSVNLEAQRLTREEGDMSYSDYLDGLRDGMGIGFKAGFRAGFDKGVQCGYLGGYRDGYNDASLGLPYKPEKRLMEFEPIVPEYPKIDPLPMPMLKPEPVIPVLDPILSNRYDPEPFCKASASYLPEPVLPGYDSLNDAWKKW